MQSEWEITKMNNGFLVVNKTTGNNYGFFSSREDYIIFIDEQKKSVLMGLKNRKINGK